MTKNISRLLCLIPLLLCMSELWADDISLKQRILMPGEVIHGHAEFEADCDKCHSSFEKDDLPKLCLDCHDEIRSDRNSKTGFHGQGPLSSNKACNTCHPDHLGRDADIIEIQIDAFSHDWTRFPLEGNHEFLECTNCHAKGTKYREAEPVCYSCHEDTDHHKGALGEDCAQCHTVEGWQKREPFDHSTTDFALKGEHKGAACIGCHIGQVYEFDNQNCVSCHKAADVHAGKNGEKCESCHSEQGWDKRVFDHSSTDFILRFQHKNIPCRACHENGVVEEDTSMQCGSCHATDDIHRGRNGLECGSCHVQEKWAKVSFNHNVDTGFPLSGEHRGVVCSQCHAGALTDPMPKDCISCHRSEDPHKNPSMAICETCHSPVGWGVISQFNHHFTEFPLVGMHQVVPCETCHVGNQFVGTASECVDCHLKDDHHKGSLGQRCQDCHSPNGFDLWEFDHHDRAGYALEGAHKGLACDACHKPGQEPSATPNRCGSCHARQDIHNGNFGMDCGNCHSKNRFIELILQDFSR